MGWWDEKALCDMSETEWEALCDRCGKCCLVKLQDDEDESALYYTNVSCKLLDGQSCLCRDYRQRFEEVPDCLSLSLETLPSIVSWLPQSCAYRRLYEGRALADWHPLIAGGREPMDSLGLSCKGRVINEEAVSLEDLPDHVASWPNEGEKYVKEA